MKLNGSATIEAAVIVPLFTMIVVKLILLAMDCHDVAVTNCTETKLCMDMEFYGYENGRYREDLMQELSNKGTLYLMEKTIKSSGKVQIKSSALNIEAGAWAITKNNPVEFVWITDAAGKLFKED